MCLGQARKTQREIDAERERERGMGGRTEREGNGVKERKGDAEEDGR